MELNVGMSSLGKQKLSPDTIFDILVVLIWIRTGILGYIRAIFSHIFLIRDINELIIDVIYGVIVILSIIFVFRRVYYIDLLVLLISFLLVFISSLRNEYVATHLFEILVISFLMYYVGLKIDYDRICELLYKVSAITIICKIVFLVIYNDPTNSNYVGGDMGAAYNILPSVLILVLAALTKITWKNLVLSIIGTVIIFAYGSRGPMLVIIVMVVGYLLLLKKYKQKFIKPLIGLMGAFLMVFLDKLIFLMNYVSEQLGMSSRITDMIMSGNIAISDGRDSISKVLMSHMNDHFWGYGLAGDRLLLSKSNSYSHNVVIELLISFGIFVGSLLFFTLIIIIIRGYIKSESEKEKGFIWFLFCCGFFKLFFSGSIILEPYFFLLIGVCINSSRKYGKRLRQL